MPRRKSTPPKSPPLTPRDLSDLRLNEQARQLFNAIQAYRREIIFAPPRPDLVYHYTSAQGLRGIVENDRLWATHVRYLNDFREIEHGCDVVRATLTKQREGKASEVVREFLDLALTSFNLNEQLDVCVACFSENGDLLSQWKMYGDDARGFSIGVPWERLLNLGGAGFKYLRLAGDLRPDDTGNCGRGDSQQNARGPECVDEGPDARRRRPLDSTVRQGVSGLGVDDAGRVQRPGLRRRARVARD